MKMNKINVEVKSVLIGEGKPKICVPIVEKKAENIIKKIDEIRCEPVDIIEWRVDFFDDVENELSVLELLQYFHHHLQSIPLLFTFRSHQEGGQKALSAQQIQSLQFAAIKSKYIDLIDIELSSGDETILSLIQAAKTHCVLTVLSNHDFAKTPSKHEMIARYQKMQSLGAHITKIAVMPQSAQDVITLLETAIEMKENSADRPFIAISMGEKGLISRLIGAFSGSAMTFASVGETSAPGQISAEDVNTFLSLIEKNR